MSFLIQIQTGNILPAPYLFCPVPFSQKKEHAKGELEMQNVVNNFSEYERVEKEKQRRNIRLSHGLKT